jgi:ABC-type branched-subunit amino acid transport system permease subunit
MTNAFDILTVACFLVVALAFFILTDRDSRTLLHLSLAIVALAIADQLGRSGSPLLAYALVAAGMAYALLILVKAKRAGDGTG